jgi:hypothetical protein
MTTRRRTTSPTAAPAAAPPDALTAEVTEAETALAQAEARRDRTAAQLTASCESNAANEAQIVAKRARGEDTATEEATAERLALEIRRGEAELTKFHEPALTEARLALAAAEERRDAAAKGYEQDRLAAMLEQFEPQWRAALEPLRPRIAECLASGQELRRLHVADRERIGRTPLTNVPELEAILRRAPALRLAWHQLHVLARLLAHGHVELPSEAPTQARSAATADVLRRLTGATTGPEEVQRRLGMLPRA